MADPGSPLLLLYHPKQQKLMVNFKDKIRLD